MGMSDTYENMAEARRLEVFKKMWRALDMIADGAGPELRPGMMAYMSKADIQSTARRALPQ